MEHIVFAHKDITSSVEIAVNVQLELYTTQHPKLVLLYAQDKTKYLIRDRVFVCKISIELMEFVANVL
jgi:hypothetical protein